jgi:hypothetical protein
MPQTPAKIPKLSDTQTVIFSLLFMLRFHNTNQGKIARKKSMAALQLHVT